MTGERRFQARRNLHKEGRATMTQTPLLLVVGALITWAASQKRCSCTELRQRVDQLEAACGAQCREQYAAGYVEGIARATQAGTARGPLHVVK